MITEDFVSSDAMAIIKKLRQANSREEAYDILEKEVEKNNGFTAIDFTEFQGYGIHVRVTLQCYLKLKHADTGVKISDFAHETMIVPNSDVCVMIRRIESDR